MAATHCTGPETLSNDRSSFTTLKAAVFRLPQDHKAFLWLCNGHLVGQEHVVVQQPEESLQVHLVLGQRGLLDGANFGSCQV